MYPSEIGKYRVIKRLGKGGMGVVYKALHPLIDKIVAIKRLQPSEALEITLGNELLENIFFKEAQILSRLQHVRLMSIWDFDRDDMDRPFFVMDYVCNNLGTMIGETFQLERRTRPMSPEKVIHFGVQILDALTFIHHNRIIHRDIKPHNILITDEDAVKLCDFGMALVDGVSFSGPDNMQIGSPYYTPPEQRKNPRLVDCRADCYSTAVLLYRLLTGTLPGMQSFPLSLINPAYDRHWDDFFQTGLQWDPERRFKNAATMQKALANLTISPPTSPPDMFKPPEPLSIRLRSTPVNKCGNRAHREFQLDELARPLVPVHNAFELTADVAVDRTTNLVWHLLPSQYPLTWTDADSYCASLPVISGNAVWRLPTVPELLSLLKLPPIPQLATLFPTQGKNFWTCDRHGRTECWMVNLDIGYAAPQDMDCRAFIRAVRSMTET